MNIFDDRFLSEVYGIEDVLKDTEPKIADKSSQPNDISKVNSLANNKFLGNKNEFFDKLKNEVSSCTLCELHKTRKNIVFGEGSLDAKLMFIGEGPGADEDETGRPFVGRAGQLLTKMIEAMKINRGDVYIANIVKCRPPNNRNPFEDEAKSCIHYLIEQIKTINPDCIVTLGSVSAKYLLGDLGNISSLRGKWFSYEGYKVMPTFHPAYLLRSPDKKKDAWEDLKSVMREMGL